jgi:hypothetical protein
MSSAIDITPPWANDRWRRFVFFAIKGKSEYEVGNEFTFEIGGNGYRHGRSHGLFFMHAR